MLSLLTTTLLINLLTACTAESNVRKGDKYYALGEYYNAATEYRKAYMRTKPKDREKRADRAYKAANCFRHINYTARAVGSYQNAARYNHPDSTVYFYLAEMQRKNGDYKKAEQNYRTYLNYNPNDTLAQNGLQSCLIAPTWKNNPTLYTIKKQPILNGRRADYSPTLSGDENDMLYITTTRPQATGNEVSGITGVKPADIFLSIKDDKGTWQAPQWIDSEINSEYDEGACTFTPDGKTMYFTRCTTDPDYPRYAQIYTANRTDASWGTPQLLEITRDTLSSFAHPAVSPDGQWLYFTSDMPGGMGGLDLWRIRLDDHGMGGVDNLGPAINTPGNEMFPTFRPNGHLYFSSDGHIGMGGLDLFCAQQDSTGTWTVENLKYPMNSAGDDFGMTFDGLHNRGFFCTNRGDARGWDHIMSFSCPEVLITAKGWVYEKDGYELPDALVYMIGSDGTNTQHSVKGDGSFTCEVTPGVNYIFLGTCKGFLNHKEQLTPDTSSVSKEYTLQFELSPVGEPVLINNVFYAFDSAELTDTSTIALDSLVMLMNENPNITIELSSHCDYRGNHDYNMRLSQRRAESVVRYLIQKGIEAERLIAVGYGKTRPKVIRRRIAERHPFLHPTDTLTEEYIRALPDDEQQEICNALNRRTEFRVLRTTYKLFETPPAPIDTIPATTPDTIPATPEQPEQTATPTPETQEKPESTTDKPQENNDDEKQIPRNRSPRGTGGRGNSNRNNQNNTQNKKQNNQNNVAF